MQIRAIEVAMSVINILLKKDSLFIDAMSVHSRLKCFQIYKNILHTHGQLGGVCDYCHLGFHSPKNISAHLLATHGLPVMRAASADLATTSAAANAALGDQPSIFKKVSLLFSVFLKRM